MRVLARYRPAAVVSQLLIASGWVGCAGGSSENDATPRVAWSIETAPLLYTGTRGGNTDLYLRFPDSTGPIRLTDHSDGDNHGRVSPDGRRIAFQTRRNGLFDIYLMDADGQGAANLTAHPDHDVLPVWSPDGSRLAFLSNRGYEMGGIGPFPGHIWVIDADGTDLRQVTSEPLTSSLGPGDWSPDSRYLLMSRVTDARPAVFLLEVVTGAETRVTFDSTGDYSASFSPDGRMIAFHAETGQESQIVIMNVDGTGRRAVTEGPGRRYGPRWSPDGQWLAFTAEGEGGGQYDIRAVRWRDGLQLALVATPEDEREPEWFTP